MESALGHQLHEVQEFPIPSVDKVSMLEVDVFPVPAASRCVVITTVAYMIVLAAIAAVRTYHEVTGIPKGNVEAALKEAFQTMTYGPMICILFLAYRMHVEFSSDGKGQPPFWVQTCMYAVTYAMLASALAVLAIPLMFGRPLSLKQGTCELAPVSEGEGKATKIAISALRYLVLLGLYGGLAGVLIGIWIYTPPKESNANALQYPAPAPAVLCSMYITVLFFSTQLIIALCRTYTEMTGRDTAALVGVMNGAASTVEFGPMLCILFLAARMRALQHGEQPQAWAQSCMFAATRALELTTLLSLIVPVVLGGTMTVDPQTKEAKFQVPSKIVGIVLIAVRYVTMLCFYGGALGVAVSIWLFRARTTSTLPISPTVTCVMILTLQFFFFYVVQMAMITGSELSGGRYPMESYPFFKAVEAAKASVQFAPMVAILFVATRMYTILITEKQGAVAYESPQRWVQHSMYLATFSLLLSAVACLCTGITMGSIEQDEDGNVINKFENKFIAYLMVSLRVLCMAMFYGGITSVIIGLFLMTPETATGRGSVPFIPDVGEMTKGFHF